MRSRVKGSPPAPLVAFILNTSTSTQWSILELLFIEACVRVPVCVCVFVFLLNQTKNPSRSSQLALKVFIYRRGQNAQMCFYHPYCLININIQYRLTGSARRLHVRKQALLLEETDQWEACRSAKWGEGGKMQNGSSNSFFCKNNSENSAAS